MKNFVLISMIIIGVVSCKSFDPANRHAELYAEDYYFSGSTVQIQGNALLPPSKEFLPSKGANAPQVHPLATPEEQEDARLIFRTIEERREICRKTAVQNANTKWLALTRNDLQPQSEWLLRLRLGAQESWSRCLTNARLLRDFYDSPDRCRVVMVYECDPRNY